MTVVDQIVAERGVSKSRAHRIARAQSAAEAAKIAFPTALKEQILELLFRDGVMDAVRLTNTVQAKGSSVHLVEVTAATWSLQKQGFVSFREKHTQHGSMLGNIKLTPAGRTQAIEARGGTPRPATTRTEGRTLSGHSDSPFQGAHHAVGIDPTDFRNHRTRTRGGEIEIEQHSPVAKSDGGYMCRLDQEDWPCDLARQRGITAQPKPEVIHQNERPPYVAGAVPAETLGDVMLQLKPAPNEIPTPEIPETSPVKESTDPLARPLFELQDRAVFAERFPLLAGIQTRNERADRYREAARLIENDEEDVALTLLEKIRFTDLEQEVLRLLEDLSV